MTGDDLAISVLTGNRPHYLRVTLDSLQEHAGPILRRAHVVVMVNGPDARTMDYVATLPWVNELVVTGKDGVRPIGAAVSECRRRAALAGRPYYMHLEDDWRCVGSGWLTSAIKILRAHRKVGQVRLRHVAERVSRSNLVTHRLIKWHRRGSYRLGPAHYTFNPSVVRMRDARKVFPCGHEVHAMKRFQRLGLDVAQLVPGAFRHIGANSLRASLGR